jgi:NADH-quinone oxidoreductase subunit G
MAGGEMTGLGPGSNIGEMGSGTAILVVACDLKEEAPLWWLRVKQAAERGAALLVANPRPTSLDKHAAQVLRYAYGYEASTVRALAEGGGNEPDLPETKIASAIAEAQNLVIIYGSEGLGLEASQELAQACASLLAKNNHSGKPNNGLLAAWDAGNIQGAWDMGLRPQVNLAEAIRGAKGVYITGADPAGESPELAQALREGGFVIVQDLFLTETALLADVVLPAQSFAEREGSFTNGERRVQRFYPAIPPRPGCLPDYTLTALIGQQLGLSLEGSLAIRVFEKIAESRPGYAGVTYQKLAEVVDQWPIVGRGDLYYGGTSYENRQGMGVQLPQNSLPARQGFAQPQAVLAPKPEEHPAEELLAVPVTRLYDLAHTMVHSLLIKRRVPLPYVALNPEDASRLGLEDGGPGEAVLGEESYPVQVHISADVPPGIVLAPRKLGLTLHHPVVIKVRKGVALPEPVEDPSASAAGKMAMDAGRRANTGLPSDQTEPKQ